MARDFGDGVRFIGYGGDAPRDPRFLDFFLNNFHDLKEVQLETLT